MRILLARSVIAVLLVPTVSPSLFVYSQQDRNETRPRRTHSSANESPAPTPSPDVWKAPDSKPVVSLADASPSGQEPLIRVALATDARSGSISTTSRLMNATDVATTLVPLDVARVRVEPRLLSPLPAIADHDLYRIRIEGAVSRAEAEQKSREIREATGENSQVAYDTETKTWGLLVGSKRSRSEADEVRGRLEDFGVDATVIGPNSSRPSGQSLPETAKTNATRSTTSAGAPAPAIRLASRASFPSREVIAFSASAARLFSSSAPVTFASDNEAAPVRFNDRPFRGRIEVFTNTRGTLTVVNVLGLEDYVRGVVANELSPGGYPALEALKAQAIAARTYAMRNRGQFMSQGFDLLPTTRSQVYRGLSSEQALSTRAVDETRGLIATYNGEPINALYTSTCGGRTEDSESIFNQAVPYLRARECAVEGKAALQPFLIKTSRDPAELREEKNLALARDVALLTVQNFSQMPTRVSDSWLAAPASTTEVQTWLTSVARLTRQIAPAIAEEVNRPAAFATALSTAVFGESRADTLLNDADVEYFLAIRDANDVPPNNRADVALLVREGYLTVFPDATLRPREPMSRARVLHTLSRTLEGRNLLQLQKGTARPTAQGVLVLRSQKGRDQPINVGANAYLFRQIGEGVYPVRSVAVVGGEAVSFHVSANGEVDYLEVRPAVNGAAADRFSPFTNWTTELSLAQVQARLARAARGIGPITDLRVVSRGSSRRATDLEIVGTQGLGHVRGGRIRSALGLREQLFVIDRKYNDEGRILGFVFTGRGWGHGVGMCQVGAYGLAKRGLSSEQILKAYYTGVEVTRMY